MLNPQYYSSSDENLKLQSASIILMIIILFLQPLFTSSTSKPGLIFTTFQRRQYSQVSSQGGRCQENASEPHPRTPEDGINDDDDDDYGKLAIDHRGKCDFDEKGH